MKSSRAVVNFYSMSRYKICFFSIEKFTSDYFDIILVEAHKLLWGFVTVGSLEKWYDDIIYENDFGPFALKS